jgi:AcrR family transcriptional regulator
MTATQLARRRKIVATVVDLVREGANEDVQMKDVADRAGVALGTIYRYFSSKDHVLAAALVEWAGDLDRRTARLPRSGTPASQLASVFREALRAYQRRPTFARLLIYVASSPDPFASECYRQLGPVVFSAFDPALEHLEERQRQQVLHVLGAVWYQGLVEWVNGRMTIADVQSSLEDASGLLLPAA